MYLIVIVITVIANKTSIRESLFLSTSARNYRENERFLSPHAAVSLMPPSCTATMCSWDGTTPACDRMSKHLLVMIILLARLSLSAQRTLHRAFNWECTLFWLDYARHIFSCSCHRRTFWILFWCQRTFGIPISGLCQLQRPFCWNRLGSRKNRGLIGRQASTSSVPVAFVTLIFAWNDRITASRHLGIFFAEAKQQDSFSWRLVFYFQHVGKETSWVRSICQQQNSFPVLTKCDRRFVAGR